MEIFSKTREYYCPNPEAHNDAANIQWPKEPYPLHLCALCPTYFYCTFLRNSSSGFNCFHMWNARDNLSYWMSMKGGVLQTLKSQLPLPDCNHPACVNAK